jgi:hypothetical protein
MASNTGSNQKRSYTIPCASSFCDTVSVLAESSKINGNNLARSVLLLVSRDVVAKDPYPGTRGPEQVVLKSRPSADKSWRRKPRHQIRLPARLKILEIHRALGMALTTEQGDVALILKEGKKPKLGDDLRKAEGEIDRMTQLNEAFSVVKKRPPTALVYDLNDTGSGRGS